MLNEKSVCFVEGVAVRVGFGEATDPITEVQHVKQSSRKDSSTSCLLEGFFSENHG